MLLCRSRRPIPDNADPAQLQVIDELLEVDRAVGLLGRVDLDLTVGANREVALAPAFHFVQLDTLGVQELLGGHHVLRVGATAQGHHRRMLDQPEFINRISARHTRTCQRLVTHSVPGRLIGRPAKMTDVQCLHVLQHDLDQRVAC